MQPSEQVHPSELSTPASGGAGQIASAVRPLRDALGGGTWTRVEAPFEQLDASFQNEFWKYASSNDLKSAWTRCVAALDKGPQPEVRRRPTLVCHLDTLPTTFLD